jgi:hypothetical protein
MVRQYVASHPRHLIKKALNAGEKAVLGRVIPSRLIRGAVAFEKRGRRRQKNARPRGDNWRVAAQPKQVKVRSAAGGLAAQPRAVAHISHREGEVELDPADGAPQSPAF